jgi:hypothetical protein
MITNTEIAILNTLFLTVAVYMKYCHEVFFVYRKLKYSLTKLARDFALNFKRLFIPVNFANYAILRMSHVIELYKIRGRII